MQVVTKQISELKRAEKNIRLHGDRQIAEYVRSIEMFGQIRPIVIDEENNVICGNGLLQALQKMGRKIADCYVVAGLTENQKKKLMLADNKIYELGVNDTKTFDSILRELENDIDIPGYDEELLKVLTANVQEATDFIDDYGTFAQDKIDEIKSAPPQQINQQGREISIDDFSDEKFDCTCPKCGFKFNRDNRDV